MGCICCPLGNFISSILYAIERISTCAACAALVCCMLFTIVVACVFGTALGYHFCTVETRATAMDKGTMGDLGGGADALDRRRMAERSAPELSSPVKPPPLLRSSQQREKRNTPLSDLNNSAFERLHADEQSMKNGDMDFVGKGKRFKRIIMNSVVNETVPLVINYSLFNNVPLLLHG